MSNAMSEEKRNKIAAAITVNAVLLIFILVVIVLAQIIRIGVLKSRKREKNAILQQYETELEGKEDDLDMLQTNEDYFNAVIEYYKLTGEMPGNK